MPNERELALFIWTGIALVWILTQPQFRRGAAGILSIAAHPKMLIPLLALAAWVGSEVWIGRRLNWWTPGLVTETGLWFVTSGLLLFANFNGAFTKPHFLRGKAVATLKLSVLLEGYAGLVPFPVVIELILQPIAFFLGAMSVFAAQQKEYAPARKAANFLIGLVGLVILGNVTLHLVSHWSSTDRADLLRQLALPVWLTLGVIPFIYLLAIYGGYEMAFTRLRLEPASPRARRRAKLALVWVFRHDVGGLYRFAGVWPTRLLESSSFGEAKRVVMNHRDPPAG
ncbi:MAG: hypothetical protein ACYDGR_14940 [Candidatus Dormibacteria bacterium]